MRNDHVQAAGSGRPRAGLPVIRVVRAVALLLAVFFLVNVLFLALNYVGDAAVPPEFVKHRIATAMKRQNITTDPYPLFRYGLPSIYSTIGIDQITDCMTYLHALYRDPDRVKNALVPGYWDVRRRDHNNLCLVVKQIAFNQIAPQDLLAKHKVRLWHGAKTALLLALPKLNFFQINTLLKQITYVTYFLLLFLLVQRDARTGAAFAPVALIGVFASGITVFGGVSHAIPYLTSLLTALGMVSLPARMGRAAHPVWMVIMGSVQAYFYEVDGSLMLASGLILYCAYFYVYASMSPGRRWLWSLLLLVLFGVGFLLSLVFKQVISFPYFDAASVWGHFAGEIKYRMVGEIEGAGASPLRALSLQFERYYFATLNWHGGADFLKFTGTWGWAAAAVLAIWSVLKRGSLRPLYDLAMFVVIGSLVLARYLIMANHSQIHVVFVSRYLFVLFAFAWAAVVWFAWPALAARNENRKTAPSPP